MANNNSQVQIWQSSQFGDVRTILDAQKEPLFCLADVCKVLDLQSSAVMRRLEDGVTTNHPILDSLGRQQVATFINEDGLYDVILDSRKPEARAFRKWVTSEVLPEIRKKGGYMVARADETPAEIMARALLAANKAIDRKNQRIAQLEADNASNVAQIEVLTEQTQEQAETIKKQAVKVDYVDKVLNATNGHNSSEAAAALGYRTANHLHKTLEKAGVLKHIGKSWLPTAKYAECNYTAERTFTYTLEDGTTKTRKSTVWTEKGLAFLHTHFSRKSNIA